MLFLIRLEQLGIRTHLWPQRSRQDRPAVHVLRRDQGLWVYDEAIANLNLRGFGLRRTASMRPFFRDADRFDPIMQDMVTPRPGLTPPPPLAPPFVLGNGRLCIGGTGKPLRFNVLAVLSDTLGFLGLGGSIRHCRLVGQLA